jgi:hypothetical protein
VALEVALAPDAVGFEGDVVGVGDEGEGDAELLDPGVVRGDGVGADADDDGAEGLDGRGFVTEALCFDGSTRRVVGGIEPEDDVLAAQRGELEHAAAANGELEVGRHVAGAGHRGHANQIPYDAAAACSLACASISGWAMWAGTSS